MKREREREVKKRQKEGANKGNFSCNSREFISMKRKQKNKKNHTKGFNVLSQNVKSDRRNGLTQSHN